MHLVTIRTEDGTAAGRVEGDAIVRLEAPDVGALLRSGGLADAHADGPTITADGVRFAPVVPNPDKIVCVGVNYADHIAEMGRRAPEHPTYFAKYRRTLIGPHDEIWLPRPEQSTQVDWEAELVVVIGSTLRHADRDTARAGIAGYTVGNDVSIRDYQRRTTQFLAGKTFEHTTPVGPSLVTTAELDDGSGLRIRTEVNGVPKQDSNTSNLVFGVLDILVDLSGIMTLDPGDLVFTGTPGGVGSARTPPEWLGQGDVVTTVIEGIGSLENRCVSGPA
jgi:acylpyruvate hydrolase